MIHELPSTALHSHNSPRPSLAFHNLPQPSSPLLSPPQSSSVLLSPPQSSSVLLSPPQSSSVLLSPPQSSSVLLSPPQSSMVFHRLSHPSTALRSPPQPSIDFHSFLKPFNCMLPYCCWVSFSTNVVIFSRGYMCFLLWTFENVCFLNGTLSSSLTTFWTYVCSKKERHSQRLIIIKAQKGVQTSIRNVQLHPKD